MLLNLQVDSHRTLALAPSLPLTLHSRQGQTASATCQPRLGWALPLLSSKTAPSFGMAFSWVKTHRVSLSASVLTGRAWLGSPRPGHGRPHPWTQTQENKVIWGLSLENYRFKANLTRYVYNLFQNEEPRINCSTKNLHKPGPTVKLEIMSLTHFVFLCFSSEFSSLTEDFTTR